ncbi:SPOR domain-containing protein [Bacillus sp. T33-2]|uniref:SPOR domain-containing protein n=1 Tax=Bacillus sp. T33-2 TaxID=2054168 RepID=UPI000C76F005|nr:SPOR domain-containing protein [Bacillus sp. T33-2]PLR93716.1 hypothetical protein CVD19_18465 [Bacillus sp. T33-2]
MDKPGKTVTIKINGKDHHFKNVQQENKKPRKKKQQRLPEQRVASWQTAAAQEEESFDWILPDIVPSDGLKETKAAVEPKKHQKNGVRLPALNKSSKQNEVFSRIFLTVLFAVILGTSIGFIILKLVTSEAAPEVQNKPETPVLEKTEEEAGGNTAAVTGTAPLKPISTYVVQGGVYTTEDGANDIAKTIEAKGIPVKVFPSNGKFALLLAAADSLQRAKQLSTDLKSKGIDVFAKPLEIGSASLSGLKKDEQKIVETTPEMFALLSGAGSEEAGKKVADLQANLNKIPDKNISHKELKTIKSSLQQASASFLSYQKTKDEGKNAEMQNELLSVLASYQTLGK